MREALLEINLWDVGQGDCTTIKLPSGKLLVIDVGPKGSPLIDWLNERGANQAQIEAIVLTHNDADHAGALSSIITEHKHRIGAIWMLLDRSAKDPAFQKIFRAAVQGEDERYYKIQTVTSGQILWEDAATQTRIHIIHPSFSQNIRASNPNSSSGVVVLDSGQKRLFAWPGDLEFLKASEVLSASPPTHLFGPHHGGPSDYPTKALRKRETSDRMRNRMAEIRTAANALSPTRAFISVGTKNQHHHPRPGYLRLLSGLRTRVVCSQLTFCCEREAVRHKRHVMQGAGLLGLRPARTGVSCRGAMRFFLKDGVLIPDEFDAKHLERVASLLRPQCMRAGDWKKGSPPPEFRV